MPLKVLHVVPEIDEASITVDDGKMATVDVGTGITTIKVSDLVATALINGEQKSFSSIEALLTALETANTASVTLGQSIYKGLAVKAADDAVVTIDLAGKNITATADDEAAITVDANFTLYVTNSVEKADGGIVDGKEVEMIVKVGDKVTVKITAADFERRRLSLSIKALLENDVEAEAAAAAVAEQARKEAEARIANYEKYQANLAAFQKGQLEKGVAEQAQRMAGYISYQQALCAFQQGQLDKGVAEQAKRTEGYIKYQQALAEFQCGQVAKGAAEQLARKAAYDSYQAWLKAWQNSQVAKSQIEQEARLTSYLVYQQALKAFQDGQKAEEARRWAVRYAAAAQGIAVNVD